MARKHSQRSSGTRISSPDPSSHVQPIPSTIKARSRSSNGAGRRTVDNQSTLTQMQFGTPTGHNDFDSIDIIANSSDDEEEAQLHLPPKKRKRNVSLPKVDLRKQTTLTQMDFVSMLRYDDSIQISDDENEKIQNHAIDMIQPDIHDYDDEEVRIIPNSSPQSYPRDPPRIEEFQREESQRVQPDHSLSEPSTPKRIRQTPIPSSQTPSATPLSVRSKPGGIPDEPSLSTSPTPGPRIKEQPVSISSSKEISLTTSTQTQTQTSPTTKRRITDFNSRWAQLSKEMFRADLPPTNRSCGLLGVKSLDLKDKIETPQLCEYRGNRRAYDLGEETQAAFIQAAMTSEHLNGSLSRGGELKPPLSSNRSFEIPLHEEEYEPIEGEPIKESRNVNDSCHAECLEESSNQEGSEYLESLYEARHNVQVDAQKTYTKPQSQISSPVCSSQASTASYSPGLRKTSLHLLETQSDMEHMTSSPNEKYSLPTVAHDGAITQEGDSLANNRPVTISQLIPSSLLGSDIPLPPIWSQNDNDLK